MCTPERRPFLFRKRVKEVDNIHNFSGLDKAKEVGRIRVHLCNQVDRNVGCGFSVNIHMILKMGTNYNKMPQMKLGKILAETILLT